MDILDLFNNFINEFLGDNFFISLFFFLYVFSPTLIMCLLLSLGLPFSEDKESRNWDFEIAISFILSYFYLVSMFFLTVYFWYIRVNIYLDPLTDSLYWFKSAINCNFSFFGVFVSLIIYYIIISILNYVYTQGYRMSSVNVYILLLVIFFILQSLFIILFFNNLLCIYLAFELQTFGLIFCLSLRWASSSSMAFAYNYFVWSCFSGIFFGLGVAFIYIYSGSFHLIYIKSLVSGGYENLTENAFLLISGLILIIISLLIKLGVAPFHYWIPYVYQKADYITNLIFSIITKLPVFIFFLKIYGLLVCVFWKNTTNVFFLEDSLVGFLIFIPLCILCILCGSVGAFFTPNIKVFLGFSSISHIGYLLIGVFYNCMFTSVLSLTYLILYISSSLLLFMIFIIYDYNYKAEITLITQLANFMHKNFNAFAWLVFTIAILNLAGFPPFGLFWCKYYLLQAILHNGDYFVFVIVLILSIISYVYYFRFLRLLYFEYMELKVVAKKEVSISEPEFRYHEDPVLLGCFIFLIHMNFLSMFCFLKIFYLLCEFLFFASLIF